MCKQRHHTKKSWFSHLLVPTLAETMHGHCENYSKIHKWMFIQSNIRFVISGKGFL